MPDATLPPPPVGFSDPTVIGTTNASNTSAVTTNLPPPPTGFGPVSAIQNGPKTNDPTTPVAPPPFWEGFGTGLMDKLYGIAHLATRVPVMPEAAPLMTADELEASQKVPEITNQFIQHREQTLAKQGYNRGWGRTIGNLTGDVVLTAPVAALGGPEIAAGTTLGRLLTGARIGALGGAVSGATEPTATLGGTAKSAVLGAGMGAAGSELTGLASSLVSDNPAVAERIVKNLYTRAIKPPVAATRTSSQTRAYFDQVRTALDTIIQHRPILNFVDDAGKEIKGQLPETLDQFNNAIEQTKLSIFQQYDALAKLAGTRGAVVNLNPIIRELRTVANDPVVKDLHPDLMKYANETADRLAIRAVYSVVDAQRAVQNLNRSLEAAYKNPTPEFVARSGIDRIVANNLRKELDSVIEHTVAPGYQGLKNRYGALKAIERHVSQRANVVARQELGGGLLGRMGDIVSADQLIRGMIEFSPTSAARGALIKGATAFLRYLRGPNRAVKKMFETAAKHGPEPTPPPEIPPPIIETGPQPPPLTGAVPGPLSAGTPATPGAVVSPIAPAPSVPIIETGPQIPRLPWEISPPEY